MRKAVWAGVGWVAVIVAAIVILRIRIPPNLEIPDPVKRRIVCPPVPPTENTAAISRLTSGSFHANSPSVSADGRFVAFWYGAFECGTDVFVHDRRTGQAEKASVDPHGGEADDSSTYSAISADGRYVAFWSSATNLVAGDTNAVIDVFVRDREVGRTERISSSSSGEEANGHSYGSLSLSPDGRFVAFTSEATNLVTGDTNGVADVFIHDRNTGQTERVSVGASREQANGESVYSQVSADGRFVAFCSDATNLVPDDANGKRDVFVRDRHTGITERIGSRLSTHEPDIISITADGRFVAFGSGTRFVGPDEPRYDWKILIHDRVTGHTRRLTPKTPEGSMPSFARAPSLSADGKFVVFGAGGTDLVHWDVYVCDRESGDARLLSPSVHGGKAGIYMGSNPRMSADGRFVVFDSLASDLVQGDTNGKQDIFIVRNPLHR